MIALDRLERLATSVPDIEPDTHEIGTSELRELVAVARRFREVAEERDRQDRIWGGTSHDDEHEAHDWCSFIGDRVDDMFDLANGFDTEEEAVEDRGMYRRKLVQVAALAVAAIESFDRKERDRG